MLPAWATAVMLTLSDSASSIVLRSILRLVVVRQLSGPRLYLPERLLCGMPSRVVLLWRLIVVLDF